MTVEEKNNISKLNLAPEREYSRVIAELLFEKEELLTAKALLDYRNKSLTDTNGSLQVKNASLNIQNICLRTELESLQDKNRSLTEMLQHLEEEVKLLRAKRFGKSSEKLNKKLDDLEFCIEDTEVTLVAEGIITEVEEKESREDQTTGKKTAKRLKLPDHLEREEVIIPAPSICDSCGGTEFRKISDDVSEVLEYIPASFKVIRNVRPRCACINCERIVQAYAPGNAIDKGKAGPGMLAHVIIQKYCDHLPLYRQSQIYAREGLDLSRSTMAGWAGQIAQLLKPLVDELRHNIFSSTHIHGDDTPVKVLSPGAKKTKIGRIWTYVRDGRGYGDKTPPAVCYFYSPDRKGERILEHLAGFKGTLHADAYAGYDKVYSICEITEAGCWSHTRRYFHDVTIVSDNAVIALGALERIGKLYDIERLIRGSSAEERLRVRREQSKGIVEELFTYFNKYYDKLPRKSRTAKAIAYALNNQKALMSFLEDGKVEIDNNPAERSLRTIAVGRKNWNFAGSDQGGETAANFYSLIETAKLNKLNPELYLRKLLSVIQDHNSSKLTELLPWNIILE